MLTIRSYLQLSLSCLPKLVEMNDELKNRLIVTETQCRSEAKRDIGEHFIYSIYFAYIRVLGYQKVLLF